MLKKILKYVGIGLLLFISLIVWILFIQPKIDHNKNLKDLESHIEFFKSIKHPEKTSEIYYRAFFGNSTGTSNYCEHIIIQIRKHNPSEENKITEYYKTNYSGVSVSFVKSLEECCGNDEYGYRSFAIVILSKTSQNSPMKQQRSFYQFI